MNTLHIDSITKSFNETKVLQDVFILCKTGRITSILGRNGCGKSTLFQIIFGTLKGDTQYIRFNDIILNNQFDRKNRIAYLPQYSFLPKNVKIEKLIKLFCNEENFQKLKNLNIIKPLINTTPNKISGGEVRLLEVLLIIFSSADFILLDEPFHSLSPKIISLVKELITEQSNSKGFIISDHLYHDVLDISNDVYLLSDSYLKPIKDLTELKTFNYLPKNI